MNLLSETLEVLESNGKSPADVLWVGSPEFGYFTWEEFASLADAEYDGGYGSAEVAVDLLIVGDTWWLSRGEYDGSEWWDFHTAPKKPKHHKVPKRLFATPRQVGWVKLAGMMTASKRRK